ncbi:diguanylate cyclase [Clostridium sp.]|uniref:diguanylate cyclase n=1 Tax=Clostridium sp. TaxID=1506 RepID=UPI00262B0174|nr:diguanylate cyclase [Clostridium sp.]
MKTLKKQYLLIILFILVSFSLVCTKYYVNKKNEIDKYCKKADIIFSNIKLEIHNREFDLAQKKLYSITENEKMFKSLPKKYKFDIYNYLGVLNLEQEKFLNAVINYKEAYKYANNDSKLVIKLNMSLAYRYMGAYVTSANILYNTLNSNTYFTKNNSYLKEYALLNLAEIYWSVNDNADFTNTLEKSSKYLNALPKNDSDDLNIMYLSYMILKAINDKKLDLVPKYISQIKKLELTNDDIKYSELEMIKTRSYALYYKSIGDYKTSIEYFNKLETLADNEGATCVSLFSINQRVSIYKSLKNIEDANILINKYYEKETKIKTINEKQFKSYIDNKIIKTNDISYFKEILGVLFLVLLILLIAVIFFIKKARKSKLDSMQDGLCNIYNRRFLDNYIKNIKAKDLPISFLMVDVDYFKLYNDNYGHQEGDLVLKRIASILKQNCRKEDIVARYGGEEFCVLLKGANKLTAMNFAKRAKENLDTLNIKHRYSKVSDHLTFSIGVFTLYNIKNLKSAIKYSDRALYISKRKGRNKATHLEDFVDSDVFNNPIEYD